MADASPPAPPPPILPPPPRRPRSLWPVAFTVVALAILAVISAGAWWVSRGIAGLGGEAVDRAAQVVREAATPQVVRREVMSIIVERPDRTPKLVVMTEPVRVVIERTDELRWLYVYWGTSSARLELAGNRVQWFVDLTRIRERDVVVDEAGKTVTLFVPRPQLDRDMVVVQTNPMYVREETDRGWARLPASAQKLADDAKVRIVPTILDAADTAESRAEAARLAEAAVDGLVRPLLTPYLREHGLTLRVEVGEPPAVPVAPGPAELPPP